MNPKLPLLVGTLLAPVSVLGLYYQRAFIWVLCPQALVVMFLRQWQRPYDSLGAADVPDLLTAFLYWPVIGWLLARAVRRHPMPRGALHVAGWHLAAIGLAFAAGWTRNRLWGWRG